MPSLLDLIRASHNAISGYSIAQLVTMCDDGILRDGSNCSAQLRNFLSQCSSEQLKTYARQCLETAFTNSGFVLQDIVNEVGRRLGYDVTNGRYRGTTRDVGFDGLWFDGSAHLVVEVKTTDAYRINLNTVCAYGNAIQAHRPTAEVKIDTLIVVGREDTGDLEAQVRGSRHAWGVRIISVDALLKLMFLNEELDDPNLLTKIRAILHPIEYTRVDQIIEMLFDTQKDADEVQPEANQAAQPSSETISRDATPRDLLEAKRELIVRSFFASKSAVPHRRSKTNFSDISGKLRATCAISKRYDSEHQPYWYALHPAWVEFLKDGEESYFILGCMDSSDAFAVPLAKILEVIPNLDMTERNEKRYWHIRLNLIDGSLHLNISKIGQKLSLQPYKYTVG